MSLPYPVDVASWSLLCTDLLGLDLACKSRCINLLKLIIRVCHVRKNWMEALSIIIKTQVNNMPSRFLPHFEGKMKSLSHLFRNLRAVWTYCSWDEILKYQGGLYLYIQLKVIEMLCFCSFIFYFPFSCEDKTGKKYNDPMWIERALRKWFSLCKDRRLAGV